MYDSKRRPLGVILLLLCLAPASPARAQGKPIYGPSLPSAAAPESSAGEDPVMPTAPAGPPPMPAPPTSAAAVPATSVIEKPFLENYPNLKPYIYKEPGSGFYMGFGLIPIGVLKDKTLLAADFFQLHYINSNWDYQILGASYGVTRAQSTAYQSNNFTFTSHVKFKWGSLFSFGPLIGYEYVTFPNLDAKLIKSPYQTPYEAYSSRGMIYGGIVSETFAYKEYLIQVSEVVYKQTYSNVKTKENWTYYYDSPDVRADPGLVAPAMVSMVEFSILF